MFLYLRNVKSNLNIRYIQKIKQEGYTTKEVHNLMNYILNEIFIPLYWSVCIITILVKSRSYVMKLYIDNIFIFSYYYHIVIGLSLIISFLGYYYLKKHHIKIITESWKKEDNH